MFVVFCGDEFVSDLECEDAIIDTPSIGFGLAGLGCFSTLGQCFFAVSFSLSNYTSDIPLIYL